MNIRDYDPSDGAQAFQGDVMICPVPDGLPLSTNDEIKPIDGRLILQEGEVTGHHHAIRLPGMNAKPAMYADGALARTMAAAQVNVREELAKDIAMPANFLARTQPSGNARLFRDDGLARKIAEIGPLDRADLVVGFLQVEHGPVVISHEEHDAIRVPPGLYIIGRQVESAGAEDRVVAD